MASIRAPTASRACWWAPSAPEALGYPRHGVGLPVADQIRLFEKLSLEGFQAGLSWLTILRKREAFRALRGLRLRPAWPGSASATWSACSPNAAIVRNRKKIEAVINNARRALELVEAEGSLGSYVWRFEPARRRGRFDRAALTELATTPASHALAKDLKRRGWRFRRPDHRLRLHAGDGTCRWTTSTAATPSRRVEAARARFARP